MTDHLELLARQILTDGHLQVLICSPERIVVKCRDPHGLYDIERTGASRHCTCPALGDCSHQVAVRAAVRGLD